MATTTKKKSHEKSLFLKMRVIVRQGRFPAIGRLFSWGSTCWGSDKKRQIQKLSIWTKGTYIEDVIIDKTGDPWTGAKGTIVEGTIKHHGEMKATSKSLASKTKGLCECGTDMPDRFRFDNMRMGGDPFPVPQKHFDLKQLGS